MNGVVKMLQTASTSQGRIEGLQQVSGSVIVRPFTADTFPWDKLFFGYSIAGTVVTILAGEIHWGSHIVLSAQTNVTIAADHTFIYVEMQINHPDGWAISATIKGAPSLAAATSDASYFRKWLYKFRLVSGAVTLEYIGHLGGCIDVPGMYAP